MTGKPEISFPIAAILKFIAVSPFFVPYLSCFLTGTRMHVRRTCSYVGETLKKRTKRDVKGKNGPKLLVAMTSKASDAKAAQECS